jgi:hypothetical protein
MSEEKIKGDNISRGTPLETFPNRKKSAPQIRTPVVDPSSQSIRNLLNNADHIICPDGLARNTVRNFWLRRLRDGVVLSVADRWIVGLDHLDRFPVFFSKCIQRCSEIVECRSGTIEGIKREAKDIPGTRTDSILYHGSKPSLMKRQIPLSNLSALILAGIFESREPPEIPKTYLESRFEIIWLSRYALRLSAPSPPSTNEK